MRISWTNPPRWIHGVVERAASNDLQIAVDNDRSFTRIIIDDSTRLELFLGRKSRSGPSVVLGAVVGAAIGGTVLSDPFGPDGTAFARSQGAFLGGVVGAGAGLFAAFAVFGRDEWQRVPIHNRTVVFPPLESPDTTSANLNTLNVWTRFPHHEAAFAAFFTEYRYVLHPIEGIFHDGASRIAIVRDRMFDGYQYVVVKLEPATRPDRPAGTILAAVRRGSTGASYEVQFGQDPAATALRAQIVGNELRIRQRDGTVTRWIRRDLTAEISGGSRARNPTRDPGEGPSKE